MSSLTSIEKRYFEDLFGLGSGYVLDYSNATFAEFFRECAKVDIYADKYSFNGDSKAKHLRAFWEIEPDHVVGKVLEALLEVWSYENPEPDAVSRKGYDKAKTTIARLLGRDVIEEKTEDDFLREKLPNIDVSKIGLSVELMGAIKHRLEEIASCLAHNAPLAAILLSGSVLEGLLLNVASQNPKNFNQAKCAPKDKENAVKRFPYWSLSDLINAAYELGFLKLDVKKFSHSLRDFRNYIHPHEQACSQFQPTKHTAEICFQVLKAAVAELTDSQLRDLTR